MNKEELEGYIKEHSMRQTAEHFDCSPSKIRYWMKKFNIKKPKDWQEGYARTYTEEDKRVLSEAIKNSEAYQKYLDDLREKNKLIKEEKMNQIKICKKCGKEFKPQKGLINFCSLTCRNTKEVSEETKKKISEGVKNSEIYKRENGRVLEERRKKAEEMKELKKANPSRYKAIQKGQRIEFFMSKDFDELSPEYKRFRIIHEQNYKCHRCKLSEWQGEKLTLEIEHVDGNHQNNVKENLIALCPNCHSLTSTWRGRNIINKVERMKKISDEDLLNEIIKHEFNIKQTLSDLKMAGSGKNYPRCHKLIANYLKNLANQKEAVAP